MKVQLLYLRDPVFIAGAGQYNQLCTSGRNQCRIERIDGGFMVTVVAAQPGEHGGVFIPDSTVTYALLEPEPPPKGKKK